MSSHAAVMHRRGTRADAAALGGASGNARLTSSLALVLLVLLGLQTLTAVDLTEFLNVHLFLAIRRALVALTIVAGVALALATRPAQSSWLSHHHGDRHHHEARRR